MPQNIEGARREPLPYGLFSVVDLRTPEEGHWEGGDGVTWEGVSCAPASGLQIACDEDDLVGYPKDFFPLSNIGEALPFGVYGSHVCSPFGRTRAEADDLAKQHLLSREEARAEQAFWTGDLGNTPNLQDGAATLGGGIVAPAVALALLEDWIATAYGSLGVIHVTRGAAEVLLSEMLLDYKGTQLITKLGTPVVAGAGYPGTSPAGAAPASGSTWAYASPAVFGYRSNVFVPSSVPGDLLDRSVNNYYAIAERTYLFGFDDCGTAAVNFALDGTP
jgi:hypothetical protein